MNMKFRDLMFFDGRAKSLRDQVHFPISDPNEMNLAYEVAIQRIAANSVYAKAIYQLYQALPNATNVADAIAS
jgi:cytochrome c peroxidase